MLEKQANPLTFLAQFIASKVGATGLTVTVDVWEIQQDGTATEIVTAGSATEIGDGLYRYILASGSVDANAEYICVFKTANTSVDQQHLAAVYSVGRAGVANLDAPVSAVEADTQNIQSRLPAALSAAGRMIASLDEVQGSTEAATNLLGMLNGTFAGELLLKRIVILSQTAGQPALQIATTQDDTDVVSVAAGGNNSHAVSLDAGAGGSDVFLNEANLGLLAAIWGYASRTLSAAGVQAIWDALTSALTTAGSIGKFLVDNVGSGGTTPAEIWDYLTANILTVGSIGKLIKDKLGLITTATEITVDSPINAGMLTITKAVSLDSGLLNATVPAGWTKCYVTGKKDKDDPDSAALFQLVESNPGAGTDGLLYLNGEEATANQGELIVDADNNQIQFTLTDNATAQLLARQTGYWDVKFLKSDGNSTRPVAGRLQVALPVTLTI